MPELDCLWFEACGRPSVGMAAHPDQGVIPVCGFHVETYHLPLITRHDKDL